LFRLYRLVDGPGCWEASRPAGECPEEGGAAGSRLVGYRLGFFGGQVTQR